MVVRPYLPVEVEVEAEEQVVRYPFHPEQGTAAVVVEELVHRCLAVEEAALMVVVPHFFVPSQVQEEAARCSSPADLALVLKP